MRSFAMACLALLCGACGPGDRVTATGNQAVLVHLKLSDDGFGGEAERESIFQLEQELEKAITAARAGEFDGNEFGEGQCTLYMYGPSAEALFRAIAPILESSPLARGATVIKRAGPPGSPAEQLQL